MDQSQPECGQTVLQTSGESRTYTWVDYNIAKLEWLRANRGATGQQIEEACKRIAAEMGL